MRGHLARLCQERAEFRRESGGEGGGYTKKDWDAVQSPELTDEQIAKAKPFAEVFPDLAASIRRKRSPKERGGENEGVDS